MEQYIPKAPVVAELERRIKERDIQMKSGCWVSSTFMYEDLLDFLDTLEVKDIDLEDNIKETLAQNYIDYIFERHNIDPESKEGQLIYYAYIHGMNQCIDTLKTQKKRISYGRIY